ncbi:putative MBL2-like secreted peptide [Aspergillus lucknowensis]|uniref:Uncharacterized protein n=1 Tax=Aspergillus lucknowensis TaxID=176173 RepID=A0ABR4M439_9EURO
MKFLAIGLGLLALTTAAPVAEPDAESSSALEKRKSAQSCEIINVDHAANCRYGPSLDAGEIFGLTKGSTYTFACKAKGDCFNGNCTWDQVTLYGTTCYVNGYFTDSNCSSSKLPAC